MENIPKKKNYYIQSLFESIKSQSQMMKLGDVVEYVPKKWKLKAGDAKNKGNYKFYSSSQDKIMYYDEYEFEDKHILLGRGGSPSVHLAENFCISHDDVYVLRPKININMIYIYLYLLHNKHLLHFTGNGLKHLSKENINNIIIPIPSLEDQNKIVEEINELNQMLITYELYNKKLQDKLDTLCNIKIKELESNSESNSETNTEVNIEIESNNDIVDTINDIEEIKPTKKIAIKKKVILDDEETSKKRVIRKKKVIE
jgi:restriction endonuclease S subunit